MILITTGMKKWKAPFIRFVCNYKILLLFFFQRDDVILALDQAEGISFNARTKRLSYSSYTSQKPSECVFLPAGF